MANNLNQFNMGQPVQGQMDLQAPGDVITGMVASSVATPFIGGQPVKMEDSAGGVPKYLPLAANTDKTDAFVITSPIFANRAAGKVMEVAVGGYMWMTAGGAIARDSLVEVVYTTNKVIVSGGTNPVVGKALDKAAADGDMIRVKIIIPQ